MFRTPDVYVQEISLLPPSVTGVATAVPAFIGYTELEVAGPRRIKNLLEYQQIFGGPHYAVTVDVTSTIPDGGTASDEPSHEITDFELTSDFYLYESIRLYFENGGGPCYVVSVGTYADTVSDQKLKDGLDLIAKEDEPTLLVVPDAVSSALAAGKSEEIAKYALSQAARLMDRFAILDVKAGDTIANDAKNFRDGIGINNLRYGAAYYPFLRSSLPLGVRLPQITWNQTEGGNPAAEKKLEDIHKDVDLVALVKALDAAYAAKDEDRIASLEAQVRSASPLYREVLERVARVRLDVPPSGAVAGVYAAVDAARGVWKAPANVSLDGVVEPTVKLDSEDQGNFNVDDVAGKSINVIRSFHGQGVLVWGARTLAGRDNEWRYVNVRRFFVFAEESIKKATQWAVFETNDANTWVKVKAMIENFLTEQWRAGALQGAKPEEAFNVKVGLGSTMTSEDVLNGRMIVEVGMAVVRPAEFIVLRFSHKLATA